MAARWRSTSNSPELCGPIDEQLQIDPALLQQAFARGLRSGPEWLDRLEHAVGFDAELEADAPVVLGTLKLLRELIGRDWHRHSSEYSLFDLEDYVQGSITMTPSELIYRIGLLAHQLENASPTALARRESTGTNRSVRTQLSGTSKSDENEYEDDFDELDEDDNGALDEKLASVIDEDFSATAAYGEYAGSGKYGSGGAGGVSAGRGGSGKLGYNDEDTYEDSYQQGPGRAQQGRHSSSSLVRSSAPSYSRSPRAAQDQVVLPRSVSESKVSDSDAPLSERRSNNSAGGARKSKSSVTTWIRDKKYQLGVKIGSGSFGEVYQCMNHEGKLFAVKQLHIAGQRHAVDALANEIQLMREFRHVNIVRYIGAAVDEAEGVVNIFQEWVPGGSVAHMLKTFGPFPQRVVASYTRQILLGLSFLHKAGIIHRDIKGGNVLVHENGTVKLADFGASTRTDFDKTQETESIKGTPYFMAPEVLAESKYGRKGDIWAVGCTIIQMFTGQPPWKDRNLSTMVQLHLLLQNWNGPPTYPHESVSADCRAAIELCFQRDSAQRPSADTLLECAFLAAEDDLDKSWGSQQLGASGERFSHARSDSGSDDRDFKMGEDADGDGDGDALGVSNTMRELKAKMTRVAGAGPGGIWRSMEAPDNQDEPTEHVRRQLADRQRTKDREQRRQRHNDDDDGHNAGVPLSDEPLPPARYGTSPQLQKPSGQETNPYARGASRSKAREVKGEPAPAAASSQHRPSSRELGKAAEAKSETPRTTPSSSASTTPTRATGGNHLTPSTSPQRGEAPLNLRVATQRDQHHIVKTSAPGSRPSSKESSASLRGPGGPSPSTQQASNRRAPPHRYGGLSSARDTEELTPSPYPNDGQAEGVGVGEEEDEDELLVLEDQGWVCQFCFKINSAEQTSYCDFCAKKSKPTPLVKSYAQSEHK